jgi:hypothetical protein
VFSGEVNATSGNFTGTINASEGEIGGFTISGESLISTDKDNSIQLNGKEGLITANKIELGRGAKIADQITFEDATGFVTAAICNPIKHPATSYGLGSDKGGIVLRAANVYLTNKGNLNLGTLELFGGTGNYDGYIRSLTRD